MRFYLLVDRLPKYCRLAANNYTYRKLCSRTQGSLEMLLSSTRTKTSKERPLGKRLLKVARLYWPFFTKRVEATAYEVSPNFFLAQ